MNIEEKIKQLTGEIESLESKIETDQTRLKLLKKSLKGFEKLKDKAIELNEDTKFPA